VIIRYAVECPGCKSAVALRLSVGLDERQPFFYVCPTCHAATRGALLCSAPMQVTLELSDGRKLDAHEHCVGTVTINPEFPSVASATSLEQPDGSAYLHFARLLQKDGLHNFQLATHQLRDARTDWPALSRLTTYYLNRDWKHFDQGLETLVPPNARNTSEEWRRDHIIHHLYDSLFMPLILLDGKKHYPTMKSAWNPLWTATRPNFRALVTFAKVEVQTKAFQDVQRDLFGHLERYVTLLGALMPGVLCDMIPANKQATVDTLRLFRDDYELLRDLYIQAFETCHKGLRWFIAAANIDTNGDPDTFIPPHGSPPALPTKVPGSLAAFTKLVSADKRKWLAIIPAWDTSWDDLFDRQMRNDIGHASARHELTTGLIHRDKSPPLPYTRFVQRAQRILHPILAIASVLKLFRVYSFA
jgi:hypothetical protein